MKNVSKRLLEHFQNAGLRPKMKILKGMLCCILYTFFSSTEDLGILHLCFLSILPVSRYQDCVTGKQNEPQCSHTSILLPTMCRGILYYCALN